MKKTTTMAFLGLFMFCFLPGCLTSETAKYIDNDTGDIPMDLTSNFEWLNYRVQQGDTIPNIAEQFGVSIGAIIACNDLHDAWALRIGDELRIPNMDGVVHTVKAGDTVAGIANTYRVPEKVIRDVNNISGDTLIDGKPLFIPGANTGMNHVGYNSGQEERFILSVRGGKIIRGYGWYIHPLTDKMLFNHGIDLSGKIGTPVMAAMRGTVKMAGDNEYFGKYVILDHSNGYQTFYAHLSVILVKQGDTVNEGSKIGELGNTGYSSGSYLHFRVYKDGATVNPLDFL
jgi:murein DD-endopeptidase MepM/ murein hydrolase activator NlpD